MRLRIFPLISVVLAGAWGTFPLHLGALDIGLAPLVLKNLQSLESTEISESISTAIADNGSSITLYIPLIREGPSEAPPDSIVTAGEWTNYHNLDLLVYGEIIRDEGIVDSIISIYSGKSDKIVRTLYARDDTQNVERLLENTAYKIYAYFAGELGFSATAEKKGSLLGIWGLRVAGGWWKPVSEWSPYLSSLVFGELGFSLIPIRPISYEKKRHFYMSFGLSGTYSYGMSPDHLESMIFHGIQARMPVDFVTEWNENHQLRFTVSAILQMDMVTKAPLYEQPWTKMYYTGGVGVAFSYALRLGNNLIGISNNVDVIFYDTPRVVYIPMLFYEFNFPKKRG